MPGDNAKAIFRQREGEMTYDAERMWVMIERIEDGVIYGTLDNEPHDMPLIEAGMPVAVPLTHVISCGFNNGNRPETPERRDYWERCFVDICVLEGRSHVDYLYREPPDMTREGDKYPDSGWRMRGATDMVDADEDRQDRFQYIAIGKVLNADDRWLHLIDEEPGVAFQWDAEAHDYIRFERSDLLDPETE